MKQYSIDPLAYLLGWFSHQDTAYQFILFCLFTAITAMTVTLIRDIERNRLMRMFNEEVNLFIQKLEEGNTK